MTRTMRPSRWPSSGSRTTSACEVVAEGVETEAQARFLAAHRCDYLQGFYFSRPLDAESYARLEVNWRSRPLEKTGASSGLKLPFKHDRPATGAAE